MKIKVTQKHIDCGVWGEGDKCPIAKAIRSIPSIKKKSIYVNSTCCWIGTKLYRLPEVATKFVAAFDGEKKVKPFEFELDLKKAFVRMITN